MQIHCGKAAGQFAEKHAECEKITCDRCGEEWHSSAPGWRDIRALGHGVNRPLTWECARCRTAFPPDKVEVYHIRHKCKHDAYWENAFAGAMTASQPCPWCGGESGKKQSRDVYLDFGPPFGRCYPDMRKRGPGDPEKAEVHHTVQRDCCRDSLVVIGGRA